jgi:hypothetical protein
MENNFEIKTAIYPFSCPVCNTKVKSGDSYVEDNGVATCLCVLPARNLVPMNNARLAEAEQKIKELEKSNTYLRTQNIKMRIDFEVLIDHPQGKAAKKILEKYRRLRTIRNERYISTQN